MILSLLLLTSCLTNSIILEPMPDNELKKEYIESKTEKELILVQAKHVIELKKRIYKLWTFILKADGKNIIVVDLRNEKDIKIYEEYIKDDK